MQRQYVNKIFFVSEERKKDFNAPFLENLEDPSREEMADGTEICRYLGDVFALSWQLAAWNRIFVFCKPE